LSANSPGRFTDDFDDDDSVSVLTVPFVDDDVVVDVDAVDVMVASTGAGATSSAVGVGGTEIDPSIPSSPFLCFDAVSETPFDDDDDEDGDDDGLAVGVAVMNDGRESVDDEDNDDEFVSVVDGSDAVCVCNDVGK
jgi:hypothetical protein